MIEAFLSIGLAATLVAGLAGVLNEEWDRVRCSVVAFESAHRRLVAGDSPGRSFILGASFGKRPTVQVIEDQATVTAEAYCGHAIERVKLVKLEAAQW